MQKVKVQRYISGKRPEYAQYKSTDEESENEDFIDRRALKNFANRGDDSFNISRKANEDSHRSDEGADDPRLRRLARHGMSDSDQDSNNEISESRSRRNKRRIQQPEVLESEKEEMPSEGEFQSENEGNLQYNGIFFLFFILW